MRKVNGLFISIVIGICVVSCAQEKDQYTALEFKALYQLDSLYGLKFDLSGIVQIDDSIYVIADKPWNKFLYSISFDNSSFRVENKKSLKFNDKLDLEGIDHCQGITYLVNERQGLIYKYIEGDSLHVISANFDSLDLDPKNWGNSGWEGIASDCSSNRLYLLKERDPRNIFVLNTLTWKIVDVFNVPETESNDFSDAKFENGHLYVIERNGNFVTKIDPIEKTVVNKYHFRNIASHKKGKLYGPTEFGMGEALLLTPDEIWIGLDNNGLRVTEYAQKTYGMSGKSPVILKFKRPIGF